MNGKKEFILDVVSIVLLIFACVFGLFSISSTLFFFASETVIISLSIGLFYYRTKRKHMLFNVFVACAGIFTLSFLAALFPSYWAEDFLKDPHSAYSFGYQYFIAMLIITWPLIAFKAFFSWYNIYNFSKDKKEESLFKNLLVSVFSIIGIGLFCLFFTGITNGKTFVVLSAIILCRIMVVFYIHKKTIKTILSKKKA